MSETWDGSERRDCAECKGLSELERRVAKCKNDFELEMTQVHASVAELNNEVHALRGDVHKMTESIGSINTSLETIAHTLVKLSDLPEAWTNLKGFLAGVKWLRENVILVAITGAVMWYSVKIIGEMVG
jgi:hypothetical protein